MSDERKDRQVITKNQMHNRIVLDRVILFLQKSFPGLSLKKAASIANRGIKRNGPGNDRFRRDDPREGREGT